MPKAIDFIVKLYCIALSLNIKLPSGFFLHYPDYLECNSAGHVFDFYLSQIIKLSNAESKDKSEEVGAVHIGDLWGEKAIFENLNIVGFPSAYTIEEGNDVIIRKGGAKDVGVYLNVKTNRGNADMDKKSNIVVSDNEFSGDIKSFFKSDKDIDLRVEKNDFKGNIGDFISLGLSEEEQDILSKVKGAPREFIDEYTEVMSKTEDAELPKVIENTKIYEYLRIFDKVGDVGSKLISLWDKVSKLL